MFDPVGRDAAKYTYKVAEAFGLYKQFHLADHFQRLVMSHKNSKMRKPNKELLK